MTLWQAGDSYGLYMGRWSRQIAPRFLEWLAATEGLDWLEVGCGTGALSAAILARCNPGRILCLDPSAGFVAKARANVPDVRAEFHVGEAVGRTCLLFLFGWPLVSTQLNYASLGAIEGACLCRESEPMKLEVDEASVKVTTGSVRSHSASAVSAARQQISLNSVGLVAMRNLNRCRTYISSGAANLGTGRGVTAAIWSGRALLVNQ